MNLVERDELRRRRMTGCFLGSLLLAALVPGAAIAQATASSSFQGTENPLNENGAWVGLTSMSPQGTRFQKNNGAFPNQAVGPGNNHAGARMIVARPHGLVGEGAIVLLEPGALGGHGRQAHPCAILVEGVLRALKAGGCGCLRNRRARNERGQKQTTQEAAGHTAPAEFVALYEVHVSVPPVLLSGCVATGLPDLEATPGVSVRMPADDFIDLLATIGSAAELRLTSCL